MTEHKNKPPLPRIEVIRRVSTNPPTGQISPRPLIQREFSPRTPTRPSHNRSSPTLDDIYALAKKERVPYRIAKGELEGKMRCRIWRKLHAEEARRFDEAYRIVALYPEIALPDAFGLMQSGLSVAEFIARKKRANKRNDVHQSRLACPNNEIERLLQQWQSSQQELSVVLADKTFLDSIMSMEPMDFEFQRSGIFAKLQIVLLTSREAWERELSPMERDSRLAQKPTPVARVPERRPVFDPRPLLPHRQSKIVVHLRNGIRLEQPLLAVGAFDIILGKPGAEIWVPLHAILRWNAVDGLTPNKK